MSTMSVYLPLSISLQCTKNIMSHFPFGCSAKQYSGVIDVFPFGACEHSCNLQRLESISAFSLMEWWMVSFLLYYCTTTITNSMVWDKRSPAKMCEPLN